MPASWYSFADLLSAMEALPEAFLAGKSLVFRVARAHSQKFLTSSWLCVAQPGRVREPTADRGRWSPQCCAGIQCSGRSWRKKRSVLSQELSSARKPFLYIYFPWLPLHLSLDDLFFCLLVEAISLSPRRPARCHSPALTHRDSLSLRARSSFQFHSFWKESRKEGPLSNPRANCSVYESIISCAHWKPTPSTRRSARLPPTPRNKQTFLKILALCREKHRLWRKQRATMRRLDHEESRHDRAGKKGRAVGGRFDTDDRRRHWPACTCMHAYHRAVFFFQQGCWNRYKPVLPSSIAIGTENGS